MNLFLRRWFSTLAGGILLVFLFNTATGFIALKRLEKKSGSKIRGSFIPHLFFPAFTLKNSNLNWQDRFEVLSGTVRVRYNPIFFFPGGKLRVQMKGHDLSVKLSGELALSQGLSEVKVDTVEADLALPEKGTPEIFLFDIQSPELKFHIGEVKKAA